MSGGRAEGRDGGHDGGPNNATKEEVGDALGDGKLGTDARCTEVQLGGGSAEGGGGDVEAADLGGGELGKEGGADTNSLAEVRVLLYNVKLLFLAQEWLGPGAVVEDHLGLVLSHRHKVGGTETAKGGEEALEAGRRGGGQGHVVGVKEDANVKGKEEGALERGAEALTVGRMVRKVAEDEGVDTVEEQAEEEGAGWATLADANVDGEHHWGGVPINLEFRVGIAVEGKNALVQVARHVQLRRKDLPKQVPREPVIRLLQINEGDGKGASAVGGGEEEVGDEDLVVLHAISGAETHLRWAPPVSGLGKRFQSV